MPIQKFHIPCFYKTFFVSTLLYLSFLSPAKSQFIQKQSLITKPFTGIYHVNLEKPEILIPVNPFSWSINLELINLFALVVTEQADHLPAFSQFKEAYTNPPVWDDDPWTINYVAHPLMGSETYLRAREAGYGRFGSFAFSTAMSLVWEYLLESWTEQPSGQDLLVTSTTGSLIGEGRYLLKKKLKPGYHWLLDPLNMLYVTIFSFNKQSDNRMVLWGTNLTF